MLLSLLLCAPRFALLMGSGIRLTCSLSCKLPVFSLSLNGGSWAGGDASDPGCEGQSSERESSHACDIVCVVVMTGGRSGIESVALWGSHESSSGVSCKSLDCKDGGPVSIGGREVGNVVAFELSLGS